VPLPPADELLFLGAAAARGSEGVVAVPLLGLDCSQRGAVEALLRIPGSLRERHARRA
jgi:hypothetical protein